MSNILYIDGNSLTLKQIEEFLNGYYNQVCLSEKAREKVIESHKKVKNIVKSKKPVYGITTGFGSFADVVISEEDTATLQRNLIISHAAGVGEPFSKEIVLLIMLYRANALSKGFSGIAPTTLDLLLDFINKDIIPVVPKYGSVGASGDLAPLSHIALSLIGEGEVFYKGNKIPTIEALKSEKLSPAVLKAKEGLALNNGTQMMSAVASYAIIEFTRLFKTSLITSGMSIEGLLGSLTPFDERIHEVRPHYGQKKVASLMRDILNNSEIVSSHKNCQRVQDAYTLRCIPQVYGACLDVLLHVQKIILTEINSATDNPLIFSESDVLSGGNFHGEPIALNIDYLSIAISEIANISERRIDRMLNHSSNKVLPAFLTKNGGLNSGMMIAQYTAAALVSENKSLSHPASVDSIPTSANQEDHVSMGSIGAVKILKILENLEHVLCVEMLCAYNAVKFHSPLKSSSFIKNILIETEKYIEIWENDRIMCNELKKVRELINSENFKLILNKINL